MTPRRFEITDFEWSIMQPVLPNTRRRVPWADDGVHQHAAKMKQSARRKPSLGTSLLPDAWRARGGLATKIHAVVDANGPPSRSR